MRFSYKFNNLLGVAYKKGNLVFTPDGNSLISLVSNKIKIYDVRNYKVFTLPVESRFNYVAMDLSPNGCTLIAVNEEGDAHMISLISLTVIHSYRFKDKVRCVKFSPDGKHFAVCKGNNVFVFKAPGQFTGQYNPFVMERVFHTATGETTCLSWSSDSRLLAVGAKDMTVRVHAMDKYSNFKIIALRNHTDSIVGCFFEKDTYDLITVSKNGQMCVWECNLNPEDLIPKGTQPKKKRKLHDDDTEDSIDEVKAIERSESDIIKALEKNSEDNVELQIDDNIERNERFYYKKIDRHYLADEPRKDDREAVLTSVDYHLNTKILTVGFSNGSFYMYEMPNVNEINSCNISKAKISAISFNGTGDWIAFGCSTLGELIVWEWQSENLVLKQQSHSSSTSCVAYSVDGKWVASGGEDGLMKLWDVTSGYCYKVFNDHSDSVTSAVFCGNKKFVVSASHDGTVRAYNLQNYTNFRTFTGTRPVQFMCVSVDCSGEFVAAGAQDVFEIYLWSVKTGKLLEILSGHEGPVGSLNFSPLMTSTLLVSTSWDKTMRIWDAIEKSSANESIQLASDGMCVVFNPKGHEVAVATLNGQIHIFDVKTALQTGTIEGRRDLGSGKSDTDLISAKKNLEAKAFTTLCYSADGEYLLAGGQSKNICIYNVKQRLLVKKFEITQNRSLDAMDDFINRRKMTDFGNLALVEEREERMGGNVTIRLPGVKKGDMAARSLKPEVRVFSLQFAPTNQQWAAATTEGIVIYSLTVGATFDPWDLDINITPAAVKKSVRANEFSEALIMSIKLNEPKLIRETMESIPFKDIEHVVSNLSLQYVEKLLMFLAELLEESTHLEFYLIWVKSVVSDHGIRIRKSKCLPALSALEKIIDRRYRDLSKSNEFNKYNSKLVYKLIQIAQKQSSNSDVVMESKDESDQEDIMEIDEIL
ncbi:periodic tryptophan protein 2 homolog [Coccinella septempunctata]|uniref:periodic tryptophan protein 2 homolog n=1 Tax=Coccinella septempunctata TaxID=41139 RepID=UPI001D0869D9|nr:periodic tryptophan protein 2 homolog [Coccinella septempunctata]